MDFDLEQWIADECFIEDHGWGDLCLTVEVLRTLLETHAIVPKKASVKAQEYLILERGGRMHSAKLYEELIKVAGENNV